MSGVSLRNRVSSTKVAQRCGLKAILEVTRLRILQWFGHAKRREGGEAIWRVHNSQVEGRRPRGGPKMLWINVIQEEIKNLGISEYLTSNRYGWREAIKGTVRPKNDQIFKQFFLLLMKYQRVADVVVKFYSWVTCVNGA